MPLQALLFDVDGTLAETEDLHRAAFNEAFRAQALPWHWDTTLYRDLLRVGGGRERIIHYMRAFAAGPSDPVESADLARRLHAAKTPAYQRLLANGRLAARPGVARLIAEARDQGVMLAIATTSARGNVIALIQGLFGAGAPGWFAAIAAGEDAEAKKPDPAVYRVALERLGLAPSECVAIEDSAIGLRAARAAGIAVLLAPSFWTDEREFPGALAVVADLDHGADGAPVTLAQIRRWLVARS
ncbi:MAG: HAD family hydrolase [Rhodospirillales bacterium]|nr:HAD family hydrolase [Rhodospirillales bacterium]MSP80908.1 HAD family hydrolase [Rhodospirillales bacterium]